MLNKAMKTKKINHDKTSNKFQSDSSDKIIGVMKVKDKILYDDLIKSCDIGLSTVMFHRSIKNKIFFPTIKTKEDYVLWLRLSKEIKIIGLDKTIVAWRKAKGSLSSSILTSLINGFVVYNTYERKSFYYSILYVGQLFSFTV